MGSPGLRAERRRRQEPGSEGGLRDAVVAGARERRWSPIPCAGRCWARNPVLPGVWSPDLQPRRIRNANSRAHAGLEELDALGWLVMRVRRPAGPLWFGRYRAGERGTARRGGTLPLTGNLPSLMRGARAGSRLPGSGTALPNMAATSHMGLFHLKVYK